MYTQVTREKADVQKTIDDLIKAIEDKETFIRVAQTRLQERAHRLGCENCHDRPMIGLVWIYGSASSQYIGTATSAAKINLWINRQTPV